MKKYRVIKFAVYGAVMVMFLTACPKKPTTTTLVGDWYTLSDFDGVARSDAAAFVIGNRGYMGTGYDGTDRLNDFWEYNADSNYWSQKADFPGAPRNSAVGFAAAGKGYIGLGHDGLNRRKDFYSYDPATNTWDSVADFLGSARVSALAFGIGDYGYVGTGYDGNYQKDFYRYDPASNSWTQIFGFQGSKRRDGTAFVINNKAYVVTGQENNGYVNDMLEFDPSTNAWTQLRRITNVSSDTYDDNYKGITGNNKVSFTIGDKGYVATGGNGSAGVLVWEYDPVTDIWTQKTSLEASVRVDAIAFGFGTFGVVATGRSGSNYLDDAMGFNPNIEQIANN